MVRRGIGFSVLVVQHSAGYLVAAGCLNSCCVSIRRPELERFRAVKAGVGFPYKVVENDPLVLLAGHIHADARDRHVQRFAVFRVVGHINKNLLRTIAGGDILRREVVQDILGKTEVDELRLYLLRLIRCRRFLGLPIHIIAAAEDVAR